MESPGKGRYLIVVENLPVPFDRRVWMESLTLRDAGYSVSVICPKGKGYETEYECIDGIHIYRYPLPPDESATISYLREYAAALRGTRRLAKRIWRERGFDVVQLCNPPDVLFTVMLRYKWRHGVRIIFDHHDPVPEMFVAKFGRKGFFYHAVRLAERMTYRVASVAISTNESHREIAIQRGRMPPERVFVVRSGPDLSRFNIVSPDDSYRRGKRYAVGYVGVMGEPEGLDLLLQSIAWIVHKQHRKDIQFMLIGSGPMAETLQTMARKLNIAEHVEFPGRVPDDELMVRLSTCEVCVNPDRKSKYNDKCTMNKILEYMALGKPVVQYDLVEGRRSAEDASLYARPDDIEDFGQKILELLSDPMRCAKMGEIGKRRMVEQLEWRHQKPKLLEAVALAFTP